MATRNRDIVYVLRMRNEARAALRAYRGDLQSAAQATAEATRQARDMARQTKQLETVMRRTGTSAGSIASNMTLATNAIRTANRELSRFSSASNQSAKSGQALAKAAQSISGTSAALRNMNSALSSFAKAAERTGILAQKLNDGATAVRGATVALKNATREATAFAKASEKAGSSLNQVFNPRRGGPAANNGVFSVMLSEIGKVKAAILGIGAAMAGAFAVKSIFSVTDEFTAMNSQLRLVTNSSQQLTATYAALFAMAQNTRQSLDGTVNLYARITRATQSLSMSQQDVLDLTDAINKSVAIFGGPAASAEAALFQLSQGFAAGQLRGEELNSVLEQSPRLAQAIADGMGVAVGSLRTLAEAGQMTSEKVLKAIMSQRAKLDKEFAQIGVTVGQAATVARNSWIDFIGRIDQATKTSQNFSRSIMETTKIMRDPALIRAGTQAMELLGRTMEGVMNTAVYLAKNMEMLGAAVGALVVYIGRAAFIPMARGLLLAGTATLTLLTNFNMLNATLLVTQARLRVVQMLLSRTGIGLGVMAIGSLIGYMATRTGDAQKATDLLADSVERVRSAYDEAGGNVDKLREKIEGLTVVQSRAAAAAAKIRYDEARKAVGGGMSAQLNDELPYNPYNKEGNSQVKAISDLVASFNKGGLEAEEFRKKVDAIGSSSSAKYVQEFAQKVLESSEETVKAAKEWKDAEAILTVLTGSAEEAAKAMEYLGLKTAEASKGSVSAAILWSNYNETVKNLGNMNSEDKKRNERLEALSKAQELYNKGLVELARLQKAGEISTNDYTSEMTQLQRMLKAAKDATYDLVDARKALKTYETDAGILGIFDQRKRAIAEEKKAYDELVKTLEHADQKERDRAKTAYNARLAAIEGQARYDLASSISEQLRDLDQEAKLIGRNTAERQRATAIMNIENEARKAGISNVKGFVSAFAAEYDQLSKIINEGKFAENMADQIKQLKQEAATAGIASDRVERLTKMIEFENEARELGLTNVDKYRTQYVAALDEVKKAQDAVNKNFALGFGEGLREFGNEATNLRSQAKDLGSGIAGDISSALKNGLKSGKFDLRDMLSNIAGRFIDIGVDNLVGSISKALGGAFDDGMSNNPVAKAKQIVDQQQNAYLMTVQGVRSAGDNFVLQLSAVYQGMIARMEALIKGGTLPGAAGTVPGFKGNANVNIGNVPTTVDQLSQALTKSLSAVGGGTFSKVGNFVARGEGNVDQRLVNILAEASKRSGFNVEAYSGYRPGDKRFHGKGMAMDVGILQNGQRLPNYQDGSTFRQYEMLAQHARQVQMEMYPELNDKFRWGGYFSGPKGKYGALDTMHFDTAGAGMGGGSWANGLNAKQQGYFPDAVSVGMQQLQTNLQQVGTAAQTAAQATQTVNTAYTATGQNTATAATAVTDLASKSQQAAQTMQTAGQNMQGAGQAAQNAGISAGTAKDDMSFFAQGISGLLGPLNQVVPGLGSFAQAIISLLSQLGSAGGGGGGILGGILSIFGFANGGIMSSSGSMPLKAYSRGGVAKSPQLAVFGEGRQNEAYVPLPDGKSIPVAMHGGGSGGVSMGDINIDIKMQGSSGDPEKDQAHAENTAAMVDKMLDQKISAWALRESRSGGMLNKKGM